ncbi:sigma 54-interacting transcriptional regulator [[Clostridium] symbiosum]|uniref:sigma 54-interacting transcriptional regulator n=1 Tax=Clostridium symbiosum TaxID=1512 RepID=UPI001D0962BD|nr:sigma 54-interacting transcriptional regulator [[Clostridium] symbiosum]MCB6610625.1 sigma 54-interacting transcriptional regulator [[Clostridium] symbiosum]MCB6930929.1 sigma 54-interacting transcriptional regulator [[Clostridium] symbiosum]
MDPAKDIVIFAPSEAFASVAAALIEERALSNHVCLVEATGSRTLKYAEELVRAGSRIFISRGRNTSLLQKNITVPVIDVPYLYEEIYHSVKATGCSPREVALVGFDKAFQIMNKYKAISGQDIQIICPDSPATTERDVSRELRPGVKALIGGFSVKQASGLLNLKSIPLMVEPENVSLAIDSALNILTAMDHKDEYLSVISATVNRISSAVLNYDAAGRLLFSNEKARLLFHSADTEQVRKLLFPDEAETCTTRQERIITYESDNYMAEYLPVIVNRKIRSIVVIVSSENSIQSAEIQLRLNRNRKGYQAKNTFYHIVGKSMAIKSTIRLAEKYARSGSAVLITGETGTGKEIFAQSIHNQSSRAQEPFVAINCAALPQSLLESELFGYVKGAFTGANREGKMGIFEMAHKGTVFLDEIGEMDLSVQAKLLRVLQEKEVCRLGDDRIIPVDIRIISATNKDLSELVHTGGFREDLLYRLNVLELHLPPLRERREDIPLLIRSYLKKTKAQIHFTEKAIKLLSEGDYPGNVRQLFNLLERIVTLTETSEILPEDLNGMIPGKRNFFVNYGKAEPELTEEKGNTSVLSQTIQDSEQKRIEECLRNNSGNRGKTAAELNISTATLWRKMKKYHIDLY